MAKLVKNLLVEGTIIPVGSKKLTKAGRNVERYHVWLPEALNDLWAEIWRKKIKVNLYVEITGDEKL